ncbi:hypothetical protein GCM10010484_19510 [Actinokineospora globicatena]
MGAVARDVELARGWVVREWPRLTALSRGVTHADEVIAVNTALAVVAGWIGEEQEALRGATGGDRGGGKASGRQRGHGGGDSVVRGGRPRGRLCQCGGGRVPRRWMRG